MDTSWYLKHTYLSCLWFSRQTTWLYQLPCWQITEICFAIFEACNLEINFSQISMPLWIYCSAPAMKWKGMNLVRRKYHTESILRNTLVILTWNQFDRMNSLYVHIWNLRQINKVNIGFMLLLWIKTLPFKGSNSFCKLEKGNIFTKLTGRAEKISPLVFLSFLVPWCTTRILLNEWASESFHWF